MTLKERYEQVANDYVKELCRRFDPDYDGYMPDWICDKVGGTLDDLWGYYINFDDVRLIIDENIPFDDFIKWYDYCLECHAISPDITTPNLRSWIKGCPRMRQEELDHLKELHRKVEFARQALEQAIEETDF